MVTLFCTKKNMFSAKTSTTSFNTSPVWLALHKFVARKFVCGRQVVVPESLLRREQKQLCSTCPIATVPPMQFISEKLQGVSALKKVVFVYLENPSASPEKWQWVTLTAECVESFDDAALFTKVRGPSVAGVVHLRKATFDSNAESITEPITLVNPVPSVTATGIIRRAFVLLTQNTDRIETAQFQFVNVDSTTVTLKASEIPGTRFASEEITQVSVSNTILTVVSILLFIVFVVWIVSSIVSLFERKCVTTIETVTTTTSV